MSLLETGLEYSAVNCARSPFSAVLCTLDNVPFGQHHVVIRFMKGVFNLHPPRDRYSASWNVSDVLTWLRSLSPVRVISLKQSTLKLTMLLALVSAQKCQTLHLLDLANLSKGKSFVFSFTEPLKHSKPGRPDPYLSLEPYPPDRRLCVITVLKEYIERTRTLRGVETKLFLSYIRPHHRAAKSTISRWVRVALTLAGVDSSAYGAHSTRMASTSRAMARNVPVTQIMAVAGWSNTGTFAKFCHRPLPVVSRGSSNLI